MVENLSNLVRDLIEFNTEEPSFKSECAQSIKRALYRVSPNYFLKYVNKEPEFIERYRTSLVYLAGLVELLCSSNSLEAPSWIMSDKYYLDSMFCSLRGYSKKIPKSLIDSTALSFSSRNYFTNENGVLS